MPFPPPGLGLLGARSSTSYVARGRVALATDRDGFLHDGADRGLFAHETRFLSRYCHRVDGATLRPVAISNVEPHAWLGYYIGEVPGNERGHGDHGSGMMDPTSEFTLELRVRREVGTGLREALRLTNFSQEPTAFTFSVEIDADFADLSETESERRQRGTLERRWRLEERVLSFDYRAEHVFDHQGGKGTARIHRQLLFRVVEAPTTPVYEEGRLTFEVELGPHEHWEAVFDMVPIVEALPTPPHPELFPPRPSVPGMEEDRSLTEAIAEADRLEQAFLDEATRIRTPSTSTLAPAVAATLQRARHDLAALRLYDLDSSEQAWTPAAGLPLYLALYGRDTLTAAWQSGLLGPEMMDGTMASLARWQGVEENDWRDEQPGRMIHEAHTGPLKVLQYNPFGRYYGSVTTSGFYGVILSELWHWTGDRDRALRFLGPALDALRWLDEHADHNGDGFYDYLTRSRQGVEHQAWKDSPGAIVYADGTPAHAPIATCEEQAFVYLAKFHLAETLYALGNRDEAKRLFREANELKDRFNEAFWMEEEGFYAVGLDAERRPITSITSNPGHCLAAGIVPKERAARVAERLLQPDLFSGWGIRTLSAESPAYNPYSYHRGTVWPVEQGTFALAFMRYGLHDAMHRLCKAQFDAASLCAHYQLPEAFSGHERSEAQPFPAFYPQSNAPQAWSASAPFCMVQALLGLYPYAPLNLLVVDPHLPDWLPELTVENLRVGQARVTIRFYRKSDGTSSYHVEHVEGTLHVVRQPSPWSLTASTGERLADALASLLPGK